MMCPLFQGVVRYADTGVNSENYSEPVIPEFESIPTNWWKSEDRTKNSSKISGFLTSYKSVVVPGCDRR